MKPSSSHFFSFIKDPVIFAGVFSLSLFGLIVLLSIAPFLFPLYFVYIILGLVFYFVFSIVDYEVLRAFRVYLYIISILFLIAPLLIGQVTRGAIRWIPIGSITLQPAEIVRPMLLIFFASYLSGEVDLKRFLKSSLLALGPFFLILIQPSLGVSIVYILGYLGILFASSFSKRKLMVLGLLTILLSPLLWNLLAPYQKTRVLSIVNPESDPMGAGYNRIQSVISAGSGGLFGRGLGSGVQTQLSFLPERQTDFIFSSIAEELGFLGAFIVLGIAFFLCFRITVKISTLKDERRLFACGAFMVIFSQTMIHIGMNLGIFPITGLPFPLVSAGGSSFLATMMFYGIISGL